MKNGSVYTPPRYLCSTFWAFVLLVAFFVFSCSNLQKENDSLSVEIQIPIEQLQKSAYMQSNLLENKTILSVAVTLFVNEIPTTQSAEGSVLELSKKIFLFRGISIGSKLRAFAQVFQNGNLICQGESQEIRLGYVQNALRIEMKIVDNAPSAPPTHVHNWDAGVITTEPTTTDDGVKTFTCSECGQTKTEVVPALGHSHNVATDWTYDETNHWHAADCGIATHIFAVDTHDGYWDAGTVTRPATCTAVGEKEFACTVCGFKKTETIPATGHSWAASYISDTDYHWHKCDNCSEIDGKTAHVWDAGTVTTEPTTTATGVMTYICICGFEKTEVIPRLVFLMSGNSIRNILGNKRETILKVVFGLLSDNSIKTAVNGITPFNVGHGYDANAYSAYHDTANEILYIVPADENATKIILNESCDYLFEKFYKCKSIEGLDLVDTSYVTGMSNMFYDCNNLENLDVSGFDTSKVTSMNYMFARCHKLTYIDVSNFDTSNVRRIEYMFSQCTRLDNLDVSGFKTNNVSGGMYDMFQGCSSLTSIDVSNFDTSGVTSMEDMFYGCENLTALNVSKFDTSNVTNMTWMFRGCKSLTELDVSKFNTSKVTDMESMFHGCSGLTSLNLSGFDTPSVTKMASMFYNCSGLASLNLNFDTTKVTDMSSMFYGCSNLSSITFGSSFDTPNVTKMASMFYNCSGLASLNLNFDTTNVTDMGSMFFGCSNLSSITFGSKFDTSNVTKMASMFYNCSGLASLNLNFDTTNVTDMGDMFFGCKELGAITFGANFSTANVTNMEFMFYGCEKLAALDLNNFNTANVSAMKWMFTGCSSLTSLDLSNFDTANVTDMSQMFSGCSNLTSLVLSSFDTANVTDMSGMFTGCSSLTSLDLSKFDTANVRVMSYMFSVCSGLTSLDLSTFNTANVTDMNSMFYSCTNLATIYVHYNPVTDFIPSGCTITNMFTGCAVSRAEDLAYK